MQISESALFAKKTVIAKELNNKAINFRQSSLKQGIIFARSYKDLKTASYRSSQMYLCFSQSKRRLQIVRLSIGVITKLDKRDKEAVIVECSDCLEPNVGCIVRFHWTTRHGHLFMNI